MEARMMLGNRGLSASVGVLSIAITALAGVPAHAAPPEAGAPVGSFAPILAKVIPAVVTIRVTGEVYATAEFPARGARAAPLESPRKEPFRAGGSGVVIDAAHGFILTNNHVIENAVKIEVGLSDGRRMPARLIGRDIGTDVAVIKVDEGNLPAVAIGDSDKVRVGDVVLAIGNPFGLEGTATLGIVSALMRTSVGHEAFEDFLQIDAQINPGNSGGALVNIKGELIGVNTAIAGGGERNVGIGFAIPINMAKLIKAELIAHGRMRRGSPGLIVGDLPPAEAAGVKVKAASLRGALVEQVLANSSAAAAGLRPGSIVVEVSHKPVRSAAEFNTRVATTPLGSDIPIVVHADGRQHSHTLVAMELVAPAKKHVLASGLGGIAGASVGEISLGNPLYGELRGAQVLKVPADAPAYATGLEVGDVIVAVDAAPVRTTDDLLRLVDRAGMQYRLKVVRAGVPGWIRVAR
jgi:Do/DeqQ family serine protease